MWLLYYCPLGAGDKIASTWTPAEYESSRELSFLHLCSIETQTEEEHRMTYWAIQRPGTFAIFCTWATRITITATWTTEEILGENPAHHQNTQRISGLPVCASSQQSNILDWITINAHATCTLRLQQIHSLTTVWM